MSNPSQNPPFFDVRMRGFSARTTVADAITLIRERVTPLESESIAADTAAGRVLAADVVAPVPVPHFDRAAFDGYAVRAAQTVDAGSTPPILRVVGEVLPGRPFDRAIQAGEAVRIMTGAPVPAGADAILPAESAAEENGVVRVLGAVESGKNIGHVGEDVVAGSVVLSTGRVLRPQDLGLLASIGVDRINVIRRPRVATLVTGDEILPPGSQPVGFRIVDSNSVVLRALVERDGGDVQPTRHLSDRPEAIRDAMNLGDWDLLLVTGGTSVGREDHAPRILADLGELPIHGISVRPARPAGIGFIAGRPVFLLPGNPVASLCAYDLFAGRAVRRLGGRSEELPYRTVLRPVAQKIDSVVGRVDYVRVVDGSDGIRPVPMSGASILRTTVTADGFVLVPSERDGYQPGEEATLYRYDLQ